MTDLGTGSDGITIDPDGDVPDTGVSDDIAVIDDIVIEGTAIDDLAAIDVIDSPQEPEAGTPPIEPERSATLVLDELGDRLGGFYSLRKSDSAEADQLLDQLGASSAVDREIILQLAAPAPLYLPERFLQAHTLMIRSVEVLDRNGTRKPPVPAGVGPLAPVLRYLIALVTRYIVRSHIRGVTDTVYRLYAHREANCMPDDPCRPLLRRARMDLDRVVPGLRRNPLGIPTFLLGGAFLSTIIGMVQETFGVFGSSSVFKVVATVALFALAGAASWVILRGAAVAHRRIDLTLDQPVAALYETIGRAGSPPKDQSGTFALVSIVLTVLAVLVVPIGLALTVFS